MLAGNGVVANGIFYQDDSSISLPRSSVRAGFPGNPVTSTSSQTSEDASSSSTAGLTGVYTATNTPSPSEGAAAALAFVPGQPAWYFGRPAVAMGLGCAFGVALFM